METVSGLVPIGEFFGLIIITFYFSKFNVNLLATIHLLSDEISEDTLLYKWFKVLSCKIKQVSSANNLGQSDVRLLMSLIYSVNNNGPRTEPCGTPQVIFFCKWIACYLKIHIDICWIKKMKKICEQHHEFHIVLTCSIRYYD